MSSPDQQLSRAGKLVAYSLIALTVYTIFSFTPVFPYQWLVALLTHALVCSLLGSATFSPSTKRAGSKGAPRASGKRREGSIKWFNGTKGYGFITGDDGAEVFVHFKSVSDVDKKRIKPNQRFSYLVVDSDRGPQAEDVQPL